MRARAHFEWPTRLLAAGLLLLPLAGCGSPGADARDPAVQLAIDLLRGSTIAKCEVLYVPREIRTPVPMTPEQVEERATYRVILEEFGESALREDLIAALRKSNMKYARVQPDLRWGCICYDDEGDRVLAMYFDGLGKKGLIEDTPVALDARFGKLGVVRLLERRFSCLWE